MAEFVLLEFFRRGFLRREVGVVKPELNLTTEPKIHRAGGEPPPALLRVREIGPDPLDGSR